MNLRKANIRALRYLAVTFVLLCTLFLHPDSAHAQNPYVGGAYAHSDYFLNRWDEGRGMGYRAICPIDQYTNFFEKENNRAAFGIIKRIVICAQAYIIPATYIMLWEISIYFAGTVSIACMLAIIVLGMAMVMGKQSAMRRGVFNTAMKIGAVSTFTFMMGMSPSFPNGLFPVMIAIIDELTTIASTYINSSATMYCSNMQMADIWGRVDCAVETLVGGIFNERMLAAGLIGFFVAAFFSGTFGLFIALIGAAIMGVLIFALLRATYITITAYVALALMTLVSPIFITMLLFQSTYGYFEKWLKVTIQFILQPIFLFAYLAMMLAAYDTVIYDGRFSVYRALVPPSVIGSSGYLPAYPRVMGNDRFQIGAWLSNAGVYIEKNANVAGVNANPGLQSSVTSENAGPLGTVGQATNMNAQKFQRRDGAGYIMNYLDSGDMDNQMYRVDIPFKKINWLALACMRSSGPCYQAGSVQSMDNARINYQIQLFIALMIALITMYIFYIMLDMLPFIGSGLAGEELPDLQKKSIPMPGSQMMNKLKS